MKTEETKYSLASSSRPRSQWWCSARSGSRGEDCPRAIRLYAKFPWGAGLKQGQPVWLVGVSVGYVDEVDLHMDGILVTTLRIQNDYKVPVTSKAAVVPNGIFGDMAVALTISRPEPRSFNPGDTVPVGPSTPGIAQLTSKADSITTLGERDDDGARARDGGRGWNSRSAEHDRSDQPHGERIRGRRVGAIAAADGDDDGAASRDHRDRSGEGGFHHHEFPHDEREPRVIERGAQGDSGKLDAIIAKVDSGPGSAAKLLNDPGVYNDTRALLQQMESLLADIKKNPKRYINVKIF